MQRQNKYKQFYMFIFTYINDIKNKYVYYDNFKRRKYYRLFANIQR